MALYFRYNHLSELLNISSNDVLCQLLCLQVFDSTNDNDKSNHGDETIGVSMLCLDWRKHTEILVRCDGTSENVLQFYLSGGKAFTRLFYLTSAWFV